MSILLLIAQAPIHCLLLRFVQCFVEVDRRLSCGQLGPLQRIERVVRKENFPHERAGESGIETLELIQDKTRAASLSAGEFLLANSDNRFDFRSELSVRSDFDGSAINFAHVALDFPLVGPEPDVL